MQQPEGPNLDSAFAAAFVNSGRYGGRLESIRNATYDRVSLLGLVHAEARTYADPGGCDTHFSPAALAAAAAAAKVFVESIVKNAHAKLAEEATSNANADVDSQIQRHRVGSSLLTPIDIATSACAIIPPDVDS